MATNTPLELVEYYQNLLIFQYLSKPNAKGTIGTLASMAIMPQITVQEIVFSLAPTSGTFVLSYNDVNSASINWNDTAPTIQSKLQAITGLSSITVSGAISDLSLVVTFTGVTPPALSLLEVSNSLVQTATPVDITITETDETLPLAVQNGFNLIEGTQVAEGVQLDILGEYIGVTRYGVANGVNITLDDSDFLSLMRMAIIKNASGSSLATIQTLLHQFFPNQMFVFDYKNMTMSYVVSAEVGSADVIALFIEQGLLPVPMAVRVTVIIYVPTANLFSFRTYELPAVNGSPFNTYADYQLTRPWLSYQNTL